MGVQTMKKQPENKVNKTKLVRELTDNELNTVAGGAGKAPATTKTTTSKGLFEVEDYSFDVEQVLNIGSSGSGAGGGK
jgi:bacteriocin-like protein